MPLRYDWLSRIKAVEREYQALRQATDRFLAASLEDVTLIRDGLRRREIVTASDNLEGTYTIRLFAEFETGEDSTGA